MQFGKGLGDYRAAGRATRDPEKQDVSRGGWERTENPSFAKDCIRKLEAGVQNLELGDRNVKGHSCRS